MFLVYVDGVVYIVVDYKYDDVGVVLVSSVEFLYGYL